jgi:hypothetical protein
VEASSSGVVLVCCCRIAPKWGEKRQEIQKMNDKLDQKQKNKNSRTFWDVIRPICAGCGTDEAFYEKGAQKEREIQNRTSMEVKKWTKPHRMCNREGYHLISLAGSRHEGADFVECFKAFSTRKRRFHQGLGGLRWFGFWGLVPYVQLDSRHQRAICLSSLLLLSSNFVSFPFRLF